MESWPARSRESDLGEAAPLVVHTGRAPAIRGGRLCLSCGRRRPLFCYRGVVKADRHHTLCFECYRAVVNRLRTRWSPATTAEWGIANPRPAPSRTVTDRAALLRDIAARRRRAQLAARHALDGGGMRGAVESLAS